MGAAGSPSPAAPDPEHSGAGRGFVPRAKLGSARSPRGVDPLAARARYFIVDFQLSFSTFH